GWVVRAVGTSSAWCEKSAVSRKSGDPSPKRGRSVPRQPRGCGRAPARRPSSWRCSVVCTDAVRGTGDDDSMAYSLPVSGDSKVRANGADAGTLNGFRALVLRMHIVRTIAYNCSGRGQAMPKEKRNGSLKAT